MPNTSHTARDIDHEIVRQLEKLRETIKKAAESEQADDTRIVILRLLDHLLKQPVRAASELVRRDAA